MTPLVTPVGRTARIALAVVLVAMFAGLGRLFWNALTADIAAIGAFGSLDYGEGIVWQQAADLFTRKAFGPIDGFPAIVYHYTPVYHAVTWAASHAVGADMLTTGRWISLVCTLLAALLAGMVARQACRADGPAVGAIVTGGAALSVFAFVPVTFWAPLMRVDMLAMALSVAGLLAGIHALKRPGLIHLAALLFVAAVYTKQTAIAAPAALFAVMLCLQPRLVLKGLATCIVAGLVVLGALTLATDGRFVQHVFLYNVNRFDARRLVGISHHVASHLWLFAGALAGVAVRIRAIQADAGTLREKMTANPSHAAYAVAIAFFVTSGIMTLTVAKSGASINYFIEWSFALAILVGMALIEPARMAVHGARSGAAGVAFALLIPALFALQTVLGKPALSHGPQPPQREAQLRMLASRIGSADKPVISDDMVVVRRGGKDVVWEPAIFAELAQIGTWDETLLVSKINNKEFAFFVTHGVRGEPVFDSRYNPRVAAAIEKNYPVKRTLGGYMIHLPGAGS